MQANHSEIYKNDPTYNSCDQIGGYSYCHQRHTSSVRLGLEDTAEEREQSLYDPEEPNISQENPQKQLGFIGSYRL